MLQFIELGFAIALAISLLVCFYQQRKINARHREWLKTLEGRMIEAVYLGDGMLHVATPTGQTHVDLGSLIDAKITERKRNG